MNRRLILSFPFYVNPMSDGRSIEIVINDSGPFSKDEFQMPNIYVQPGGHGSLNDAQFERVLSAANAAVEEVVAKQTVIEAMTATVVNPSEVKPY